MHKRLHARSVPDIIRYPTNSTNLVWAKHLFHPRESITKIHKLDLASVEQLPDEETIE